MAQYPLLLSANFLVYTPNEVSPLVLKSQAVSSSSEPPAFPMHERKKRKKETNSNAESGGNTIEEVGSDRSPANGVGIDNTAKNVNTVISKNRSTGNGENKTRNNYKALPNLHRDELRIQQSNCVNDEQINVIPDQNIEEQQLNARENNEVINRENDRIENQQQDDEAIVNIDLDNEVGQELDRHQEWDSDSSDEDEQENVLVGRDELNNALERHHVDNAPLGIDPFQHRMERIANEAIVGRVRARLREAFMLRRQQQRDRLG